VNRARGEWQISRCYAVCRIGERALHYGRRYLADCESAKLGAFDWGYAYESISRAYLVSGDIALATEFLHLAQNVATSIADEEERQLLADDLRELAAHIGSTTRPRWLKQAAGNSARDARKRKVDATPARIAAPI
jgi:hypothetical protein